jgi:hypothetical protein
VNQPDVLDALGWDPPPENLQKLGIRERDVPLLKASGEGR